MNQYISRRIIPVSGYVIGNLARFSAILYGVREVKLDHPDPVKISVCAAIVAVGTAFEFFSVRSGLEVIVDSQKNQDIKLQEVKK